jgi:hypothetical protein
MNLITLFVMVAAGLAALSLLQGVMSMAHGGASDQLHSHEHMFRRTGFQALAVALVLLAMLAAV